MFALFYILPNLQNSGWRFKTVGLNEVAGATDLMETGMDVAF